MEINSPIVACYLDGDVVHKVKNQDHTLVAAYDAVRKETCCIVSVSLVNRSQQHLAEKQVASLYSIYGKVKKATYYKDGADVFQMVTNN
jgi:hypothetical protein